MQYDDFGLEAYPKRFTRIKNRSGMPTHPGPLTRNTVTAEHPALPPIQIKTALIDSYSLSRDCIISATRALCNDITFVPFGTIRECMTYDGHDLDLVIYYSHDEAHVVAVPYQEITTLRQAFSGTPIIVMSDAKQTLQSSFVRDVIRSGARGFILTRTIEMPVVSAAIRYVKEGGTVFPVETFLTDGSDYAPPTSHAPLPCSLTSRQMAVLSLLRQGKANKLIAHDLRMSESTVKVHIRNIMRKMGATNRTQAVYNYNQIGDGPSAKTPQI